VQRAVVRSGIESSASAQVWRHRVAQSITVSIQGEQGVISAVQPTASHHRHLLEELVVSLQNPQSNPTHLSSETINSTPHLMTDERTHPLSRGLPALIFYWQFSRYVGT